MPRNFILSRRFWTLDPVEKVVQSKKDYKRKNTDPLDEVDEDEIKEALEKHKEESDDGL